MTRNNKLLLGILAFIVTLTIGYAVFTQSVTVTGTATASGTFNMMITNARVKESKGVINPTVNVSADKQSITVSTDKLEYPGAYVTFEYTLKNAGTINAMYKTKILSGSVNGVNIEVYGNCNYTYCLDDGKFFVSSKMEKFYFNPNDTSIETFTITWNPEDEENDGNTNNLSYSLSLNFEQISTKEQKCNIYSDISSKILDIEAGVIEDNSQLLNYFFDITDDGLVDSTDAGGIVEYARDEGC